MDAAEDVVRRFWLELWGGTDVAVIDTLFARQCVRHNREGTEVVTQARLKELFTLYRATFAGAPAVRVDDLSSDGERVWSRAVVRWVDSETGAEHTVSFLQQARVVDGRIVETWSLAAPEVDWRSDER